MNKNLPKADQFLDLDIESLESREMLAGDVEVIARHGDVIVNGDSAANNIRLETVAGQVRVTGIDGTRVNGVTNGVVSRSISDDLRVNLKHGNNQLLLGSQPFRLSVPDDLSIKVGSGDDVIVGSNVVVGDDVSITMGHGYNRLSVFELSPTFSYTVGDDLKISSHGFSDVYVDWRVSDDTRISTSHKNDWVRIFDSVLAGDVSISTKGGNDIIDISRTVIAGDFKASTSGGDDTFTFGGTGSFAYNDIRLAMGSGFDYASITARLSANTDVKTLGVDAG